MSIHNKLILPLISNNITLEDISKETGFAGIYTLDINKPFLTNHVFLLYKKVATIEARKTREKLENFSNLYNKRTISLNGILYNLYSFTINYPIKIIKDNGHMLLGKTEKTQIGKFWKFLDTDVTDYLLGFSYIGNLFKDTIVPEEDFTPKDFLIYDEKREALAMSVPL